MMEIREIDNKEIWEGILSECEEKTFLNSWNWAEFQKKEGFKMWRLGIYENGRIVGTALAVKIEAKRGKFLFVPHGPTITQNSKLKTQNHNSKLKTNILRILLEELKKIAQEEKASFIRIAPIWERNEENIKIFKELGFKDAPIHIHPEITWELDITPSESDLLAGMRKTTRYLIRQAEKNQDIEIVKSADAKNLEKFENIYKNTADRHHFISFPFGYLKNQFSSFSQDSQILILFGKYKNQIISSAIIVFWQGIAFYHHGASLTEYRNIPASYLLQWEAIKEAKKRGCRIYNFWGVAEKNWKLEIGNWKFGKHPWWGLTLFKKGFGGYLKEYVKTQDFVISKRYYLTYFFEKLRKMKRGL